MGNLLAGWIALLSRRKAAEHSVVFRAWVLATVLVGITAACHMLEWPPYGYAVLTLTPLGFILSYRRREANNWILKAFLSILMVVALGNFLLGLMRSPHDPRLPLAELLLWLQTLHSYDLPARRDLNYSLVVALILLSLAAVLSYTLVFGFYLAAFLGAGLMSLHYNYLSTLREEAGHSSPPLSAELREMPRMARLAAHSTGLLLAAALLVYAVLPRYEGMHLRALPVSWKMQFRLPHLSRGAVVNPAYPARSSEGAGRRLQFNPDSYFGFNPVVDLNLRGKLSREIVMRVRTTDWSYYRGLAFNRYDGFSWSLTEQQVQPLRAATPPIFVPLEYPGDHQVVHIYHVEKELPNVVFVPFQPYQLYFPSQEVFLDQSLGVRSPFPLEEGMVYSAIGLSRRPTPQQDLRKMPPVEKFRRLRHHPAAQLPETVPERVRTLAHRLTDRYRSPYEKAMAVCLHLQRNYTYTLDVPPYPPGAEVSDYFLFEERSGYCEQFATTMAVLCRAVGIPARYVTGYTPGSYNPLTGYYEVRGTDAHAWVEVLIPAWGWMSFDPSPGYAPAPELDSPERPRWLLAALFDYLQGRLPEEQVAALRKALRRLRQAGWECLSRLEEAGVPRAVGLALIILGVGGISLWAGVLMLRKARRTGRWNPFSRWLDRVVTRLGSLAPERPCTPAEQVVHNYRRMVRVLERLGYRRRRADTPREYARRVNWEEVAELTEHFQEVRYRRGEADEFQLRSAREALERLLRRIREDRPSRIRGNETSAGLEKPPPRLEY